MSVKCKFKLFNEFYQKIYKLEKYEDVITLYDQIVVKTDNEIEKKLIFSLIDKRKYEKRIEFEKFKMYLDIFENIKYYHDAIELLKEFSLLTNDKAQLNTLEKLISKKPLNENNILNLLKNDVIPDDNYKKIMKNCPHCDNIIFEFENMDYIICGYSNKGFDWKGCGYDWCFKCGKKLCKNWNLNELFNKFNRFHNNKCCKMHANKIGNKYPTEYCQCDNNHVRRNHLF
ncbi:Hypothetical protein KVN_LOCUS216 [uncultured virus]|nr:Hypothetical protein KVN_LOCUS216 [uncultured virus]